MAEPRQVAIVGAGPAGLFAAERLAQAGCAVTIHDRMPSPARKFLMAGRGGLNLTHSEPFEAFLSRYSTLPPQLRGALEAFPPQALRDWADDLGADTFVGSSGRVFPKSLKASPLLRAWLARLDQLGVTIRLRHDWQGWTEDGALAFRTSDGEQTESPDATLLALGGASWSRLGADGSWQGVLAAQGVGIAPLQPSNAGAHVEWSEHFSSRFAGQPLKRIALRIGDQGKRGELVVTRSGIEGGALYALSGALRAELDRTGSAAASIDLRPDLSETELSARLARPRGSQSASTFLRKTAGLSPVAIGLLREAGPLPRDARELAPRIKAMSLHITGLRGIDRAISTAGGVAFDKIDGSFMLRRLPGVFCAGEMLDWDAPTGGYLLQACFATGLAAAEGILARFQAEGG